jgi:hypothetical protein
MDSRPPPSAAVGVADRVQNGQQVDGTCRSARTRRTLVRAAWAFRPGEHTHQHREWNGIRPRRGCHPEPAPNELVIEVAAAGVNTGDIATLTWDGWARPGTIPGWDAAGTVVRAAGNGSGPSVGAPVVSYGSAGGWAERRAVDSTQVAAIPTGVHMDVAGAVPVASARTSPHFLPPRRCLWTRLGLSARAHRPWGVARRRRMARIVEGLSREPSRRPPATRSLERPSSPSTSSRLDSRVDDGARFDPHRGPGLGHQVGSAASIAATTLLSSGSVRGPNRATTSPDGLTRNFSKFQRMSPW